MKKLLLSIALVGAAHAQVIIAYGDMRFTDPNEQTATNPKVRRWLVNRIAEEKPDAILLSGDLPWNGAVDNDYAVYHEETAVWRNAHLVVSPALGNHEFHGDLQHCLDNWWREFPNLKDRRWHSTTVGPKILVLNLDSTSSLLPDSAQIAWVKAQLNVVPATVRFVFINLHHPPVADVQAWPDNDHNPRPNEIALAQFLENSQAKKYVRFVVCAGHIHNYERFFQNGVVYLVSGGGGAKPRPVVREASDLYKDPDFPNYNYVKFVLNSGRLDAQMVRVADPIASTPSWQIKDRFQVPGP